MKNVPMLAIIALLLAGTASFVASWGIGRWRDRQPRPARRDAATECAWGAAPHVREQIIDAGAALISNVDACGGFCIVIVGTVDALKYQSNLPRATGIDTLEACAEAMRARYPEDEPCDPCSGSP